MKKTGFALIVEGVPIVGGGIRLVGVPPAPLSATLSFCFGSPFPALWLPEKTKASGVSIGASCVPSSIQETTGIRSVLAVRRPGRGRDRKPWIVLRLSRGPVNSLCPVAKVGMISGDPMAVSRMGLWMGCVWFSGFVRVWVVVMTKTKACLTRKGGVWWFSPELGPVLYGVLSGVGSSFVIVLSAIWPAGVGSGWVFSLSFLSTGVLLGLSTGLLLGLFFWCGFGPMEFATYWIRSSRFTRHCSSLGSHPPQAQSPGLIWPRLKERFGEACGCERHLFSNSFETVGPHHLTSFDLSIKIGRVLVARSCVIIWRFLDLLRSFGSRTDLWSWIPLYWCNPIR